MYFKKLDITFDVPDFETDGLAVEYGYDIQNKFRGIWYNHIKKEEECILKHSIPDGLRDHFTVQLMEVNSYIPPHTDSDTLAAINFYINTSNCVTSFYDKKEGAEPHQIKNQTNGCIYNFDDLNLGPGFQAEPGDVYLLDVSKVHSVIPLDNGEIERKALCLSSSSLNFEQVQELF